MKYEQLVEFFDGLTKAADALGVDRRVVDRWKRRRIPSRWQMKAQALSGGTLQADRQARDEAAELASYLKPKEKRVSA